MSKLKPQTASLPKTKVWVFPENAPASCVNIAMDAGKLSLFEPCEASNDCHLGFIPLGVDPQVHTRTPGQPEKETPAEVIQAACHGGIGAMLAMPNTRPTIDNVATLQMAQEAYQQAIHSTGLDCKILQSAAITKDLRGKEAVDFKALFEAGAVAFTDDGLGVLSDSIMEQAFQASSDFGVPILQHAEMPGHGCVLAEGPVQTKLNLKPYPEAAEVDMVARDLELLKKYPNARYHVLHVSSAKTLELVDQAKQAGLRVSCEVSPHHLFFCSDDIDESNSSFKMNPPLRSAHDRKDLRRGLESGLIDFVATDHAPHEPEAKTSKFSTAAFGTTGLETSLRTLVALYQAGELPKKRLLESFCYVPAKFLDLKPLYRLELQQPAQGILLDFEATSRPFTKSEILSHSHNSCFLNSSLPDCIHSVFLGNQALLQA